LLQVGDYLDPFIGFDKLESHIAVRNELFGAGQPFVERVCIPRDMSRLKRIRVFERRHSAGYAAVDTTEARTFLLFIQRVAAGTAFFEKFLAALSTLGLARLGQRNKSE